MWPDGDQSKLVKIFGAWKAALLVIAALSPGDGYDTSTALLLLLDASRGQAAAGLSAASILPRLRPLLLRLVRWDAVYFTSIARDGYAFEQEWAFGWGFSRLVSATTAALFASQSIEAQACSAVIISTLSHLCSVLLLHELCRQLFPAPHGDGTALFAAALHVVAPAGIFLSAPYGESTFSALSFAGFLLYARSLKTRSPAADASAVLAGLAFGAASTVRGNGILSGVLFAADLALTLFESARAGLDAQKARYCAALVAGGSLVALGFALPQAVAFREYCMDGTPGPRRPWCTAIPPSVYSFVQKHYWGSLGFLGYWTLSNAPLFLLAAPMLSLMLASSIPVLTRQLRRLPHQQQQQQQQQQPARALDATALAWRLALPQAMLGLLAITNLHVQIITRLASGYVLPYVWIAQAYRERRTVTVLGKSVGVSKAVTRWMVMYALIQGGLYASFLPPA